MQVSRATQRVATTTRHCHTQWRNLPTSVLTKANKEGGKGEGQTASQMEDLELETTAQPPRVSTGHLELGDKPYVK